DQRRGYGIAVWGAGGAAGAAGGAAAGPAVAQAGGAGRVAAGAPAYVPAQPPAPGAPGEGEDDGPGPAALQGLMGVGRDFRPPARPTVQPVTVHTVRWVAAESVEFPGGSVGRGDDVAFNGSEMVSGRKGVIVLMGVSVLMEDIGDADVEAYRSKEAHHDARLLKLQRDSRGDRHRPWRDVARDASAVKQTDWPVPGPQTAEWCTKFLDRLSEGPVGWDRRWRADNRLSMDQWGVSEHETLAKILERLGTHDQCDVVNLAAAEDIVRRMQVIEYFYYEVHRQSDSSKQQDKKGGKGARLEEMAVFSGKHREYGEVMVAPELLTYVASELERERSLGMIQAAVAELGRPPADLTRQGALAELLAKRSYTGEKAAARVAESALKRPCYDPSLQGRPRRYARLLAALDGAGMLEWRRRGSPRVGLFTVWKKNGKQRLIVDARLSNLCFASPDPVDLATGGSLAPLEVDPGPPVCLAQVDIQDAFYHLLPPPELAPLLCLRPVTAGLAGVSELDGAAVSPTQLVYPHLRVVPMGWNHALWWCQRIHEFHAFRQPGVFLSNKLSDKKPGVRLGRSGFAHTEYVDNFAAIGRQASEVDAVADSVLDALTTAGLCMHPRESSVGGSVLGWEFSDECPQVRASPRRVWRLRLGIEGLLERGFATGRDLEAIIGHFTFAARIRPEALCVFSAAYAFSQRGADTRRRPGGSAKRRPVQGEPLTLSRAAALSKVGPRPRPTQRQARAKASARPAKPRPEVLATRGERAAVRQAKFPEDKRATDGEGLSLLERESVGDHNQRVYQSVLVEFRAFSKTLGLRLKAAQDYDEAAVEWAHHAFFDGGDAQEGTRLKAVLLHYYPRLLSVAGLPRFSRALKGWRRLVPPRSRLPLPWEVACAVANKLVANQDLHAARLIIVMFVFYLRPVELMSLTGRQVVPPVRAAGHDAWSLVLFPMEEETPSKTSAFNESVLGDLPFYRFIGDVLKLLKAGVDDKGLVAQVRHVQLAQAFRTAGQQLGLEGPPGLYQLRHGGASADLASGRRGIAEVKARGRWASDSSVTRYGKGGRIADQLAKLPQPFLDHAIACAKKIGPPPLRSDLHVMGLPDLAPRDAEKVRVGNALMKFSASLFMLCQAVRVPVAIENPHMSRIWLTLSPQLSSDVVVHYTAWKASTGEKFDDSYMSGQPASFKLDAVIPGWSEGVRMMREGEVRRLWVPAKLAYGPADPSGAEQPGPPKGDLVYEMELLK
ncbi:unnamed protein product, partial [Prorocentrum cordatum]